MKETRSVPSWVNEERAFDVSALKVNVLSIVRFVYFLNLKTNFPELFSNLRFDDSGWSKWNSITECETKFPQDKQLTGFQQLLVIQAFRPDRLESAMRSFVCDLLGINDISPETLNLKKLYAKETIATEPILIIISPGADPSAELRDLATEITGKDRYSEVNNTLLTSIFTLSFRSLWDKDKCK